MRRSWLALLVVAAVTALACAHPNEVPLPGESPPPAPPATSGPDETATVCSQARSISRTAVDNVLAKLEEAQSLFTSGNQAGALAAANTARTSATQWKDDLADFASRPVRPEVRTVLNEGVSLIDRLLGTSPDSLNPTTARADVEQFLDKLDDACG